MKKPRTPDSPFAEAASPAPGAGLRLAGKASQLSAAQQRLNRLLAKLDRLRRQIADMEALLHTYRPRYHQTLAPLRAQQKALMRRMALWLDERLAGKGLMPAHRRSAIDVLCRLCEALAATGDEAMAALHDRHSPQSLREKAQAHADLMQAMMEGVLGQSLDLGAQDASLDPLEAVMRASRERLAQAAQAEQDQQEAAQARKKKKPTAAQRKAAQAQEDAETILRQVYRQLASALHPDRERDPAEHRRKTGLMSQANAAYARHDLLALLQIQLEVNQADPDALMEMPEEKIAAMTSFLRQQAAGLEGELSARRTQVQEEFGLDIYQTPSAASLQRQLVLQEEFLRDELAQMQEDLQAVQDDEGFKRWLRLQKQLARHEDDF